MHEEPNDEFTPRDLGLLAGNSWASHVDREVAKRVADTAEIPEELRAQTMGGGGMSLRLDEYGDDPTIHDAFWRGFVHGVRSFIIEDLNRTSRLN